MQGIAQSHSSGFSISQNFTSLKAFYRSLSIPFLVLSIESRIIHDSNKSEDIISKSAAEDAHLSCFDIECINLMIQFLPIHLVCLCKL
jgi:hypothetical protein